MIFDLEVITNMEGANLVNKPVSFTCISSTSFFGVNHVNLIMVGLCPHAHTNPIVHDKHLQTTHQEDKH